MRIYYILVCTLFFSGPKAMAVKGSKPFNNIKVESALCKLDIAYPQLNGENGVCSSIILNTKTLITAKHCLYKHPNKMATQAIDPLERLLRRDEIIDIDNVSITCQGRQIKALSFKIHPRTDLAKINLEDHVLSNLSRANDSQLYQLAAKKSGANCSLLGYGQGNDDQSGSLNAVKINVKAYEVGDAFLETTIDADFKHLAMTMGNVMAQGIFMEPDYFPRLFHYANKEGIDKNELMIELDRFKAKLSDYTLTPNSIFNVQEGPQFKKLFLNHFTKIYAKVLGQELFNLRQKKRKKMLPDYRFITNVENTTPERAGVDYGDSGGALVCQWGKEWKLAGVISKILFDSNKLYIPRPWEPMNFKPIQRITKNGEVIGLFSILDKDWK